MPQHVPVTAPVEPFTTPPDPAEAAGVDDLIERLRLLKVWAGDPSYETIKNRVNAAWSAEGRAAGELTIKSTVANCFQTGRRRLNTDLVLAVVQALHPDTGYVGQWRHALRTIGGKTEAVSQVRVQSELPPDLVGFIGRGDQLGQLGDALRDAAEKGDAVVISAIEGMAGVGKTQLAVHAGHLLLDEKAFDRVLFVNLRGFHPDPAQPPADPAAVLDGFLRLLGVPGQRIPHALEARTAAYRDQLAGNRVLIVLDNAATAEQVGPLLPDVPGCLTLITSRRSLTDLRSAGRLEVDVFTPAEAVEFLTGALPAAELGLDPGALDRIARRCGYLPLALSLIAGHIRSTPDWTLTDHADRLDERHDQRRLDTGVELALALSYQHLAPAQQKLLRLVALHPGQDFDAYAAAALTGTDLSTAAASLEHLCRDHLLLPAGPGRYAFHDLVRAYAVTRARDQDPPAARRTALTHLFDYYLVTVAAAMNVLHPAEAHFRPQFGPSRTPTPDLGERGAAVGWLDGERHTLVAVAVHTATQGWPRLTTKLSHQLFRYLIGGGHHGEALTVYTNAHEAALRSGDRAGEARTSADLGISYLYSEQYELAAHHLRQGLEGYRRLGDSPGQTRVMFSLAAIEERAGRFESAVDLLRQTETGYRQAGDPSNASTTMGSLANLLERMGRSAEALDASLQALELAREAESDHGEAYALEVLASLEMKSDRFGPAGDHLRQCLALRRQQGNRLGEGSALDTLGLLHTRLDEPEQATACFNQALTIFREVGSQEGQAFTLNGLGENAHRAGRPAEALTHHAAAHAVAADIDNPYQLARAATGLGHAHHALGDPAAARSHYEQALELYTGLGVPDAEQVRARLDALAAP